MLGKIGNMSAAIKRQQVVFTQREKIDVFYENHLLVVFGKHRLIDDRFGVFGVPFGQICVCPCYPSGGFG
jgi:hypothetical protein